MPTEPRSGSVHHSVPVHVVSILKIDANSVYRVRLLAYTSRGTFYHWTPVPGRKGKERSRLCSNDPATCPNHKLERYWHSYQCVEVLGPGGTLWYPMVLEVSEHLELDFRGRACRGQVWDVARPEKKVGKRSAVNGVLIEQRDPALLPAAFDVQPVLRTVYHCDDVPLTQANPLPPRVILAPTPEPAPPPAAAETPPLRESLTEAEREHPPANGKAVHRKSTVRLY